MEEKSSPATELFTSSFNTSQHNFNTYIEGSNKGGKYAMFCLRFQHLLSINISTYSC